MVTLDPPVLVTVSERDLLLPRVMLPKLRLVGFAPSAPAVTPVPVRGMVRVGLEALEVMVTEPVALPAAVGEIGRASCRERGEVRVGRGVRRGIVRRAGRE